MSHQADTAAAAPAGHAVRPFYWSLRRELWEHRAIYLAPLAVAAIVLAAFIYSSGGIPALLRAALEPDGGQARMMLHLPYAAAAGAVFVITQVVAVFYCLGALHGERRDRSLLFWKSLPVSDRTAVLAKAAMPLAVAPLVIAAVAVVTQLVILAWSSAVIAVAGLHPADLWSRTELPFMWAVLLYGLVVNALWFAPIVAWLLMVSAWARRTTFIWAVAPWLGMALFEFLAFHTHHVWSLIDDRLNGGLAQAFSVRGAGKVPLEHLSQLDPAGFFSSPGLWGGLVFAVAGFAVTVWLRRTRDPL